MSWGGGDFTTELNRSGVPQLTITYPGYNSYRAEPLDASVAARGPAWTRWSRPSTSRTASSPDREEEATGRALR